MGFTEVKTYFERGWHHPMNWGWGSDEQKLMKEKACPTLHSSAPCPPRGEELPPPHMLP